MNFELATVVASWIAAISTIFVAIFVPCQIRHAAKIHSTSIIFETNKILRKIRPLYQALWKFPNDFNYWDLKQREIADLVGVELQRISYLCIMGLVSKKVIMELQGKVFVDSWNKSEEWTKNYREEHGEPREIKDGAWRRKHFELFAEECKKYLIKKGYYRNDS